YRSFHQSTWKEAINVKEGDYLSVLKPTFPEKRDIILNPTIIKSNSRTPKQVKTGFTLNEHVARLFGCYIGDGSYSGAPTITFNSSDRNIELYRSIITDELGYETNTRDEKDRNVTQLKFGGTVIGRFLTDCFGSYATSKKIPRFIFNSPTNIVTEFIRGYIDADGYTQNTDNNNIKKRISTASQGLALQLQLLILTKFGELPAVFKDEREGWIEICGVKTYQHDKYEVHIYSQTVSKIFGNIYKSKIGRRKWFEHNNRIYVPVTKVDHYPFDGEVYNLTTEDSMLPINNIITHNCGDHDPSGLDMVRDIRDRLEEFGLDEIEVRHIAITREQIDEYNPPPNPAKVTDPRAKEYIALHGNTSWEVDALNPETLHELLVNEIEGLVNRDKYEAVLEQEEEDKEKLREFADRYNEEE
ncbi:hypothetical protein KKE60_07380, partial [Patescibacteria group bacterium]|nr:hypothetical protein [Patescibacteria group bacterium]